MSHDDTRNEPLACERAREWMVDHADGALAPGERAILERHLTDCAGCRAEAASLTSVWNLMGEIEPAPVSANVRDRFYAMLESERARETAPGWLDRVASLWRQPAFQVAWTAAVLLIGVVLGPRLVGDPEVRAMREELQSIQRAVSLPLLQHPSASERLRGVSLTAGATSDEDIVTALLRTIAEDESVNVRIAALDVLAHVVDRPEVGHGLLRIYEKQESPVMQVALAEVLARSPLPESRRTVESLADSETLPENVREHLHELLARGDRT